MDEDYEHLLFLLLLKKRRHLQERERVKKNKRRFWVIQSGNTNTNKSVCRKIKYCLYHVIRSDWFLLYAKKLKIFNFFLFPRGIFFSELLHNILHTVTIAQAHYVMRAEK